MIDSATGASPPRFQTKDVACSPIRFQSSIESTTTSENLLYHPSGLLNRQERDFREKMTMRTYVFFVCY